MGAARPAGEQTPLMMAARGDHEDVMRALVAAGADPALKAQDGIDLLMAAAAGARLKTFKYAFEIDPHVDVVTTTGNTVMHVAVGMNGRTQPEVCEVIQFLADHGARLDEMNGAGRTPIAIADNLPVDLAVDLLTKLITERGEVPKIPPNADRVEDTRNEEHCGAACLVVGVAVWLGAQAPAALRRRRRAACRRSTTRSGRTRSRSRASRKAR